MKLSAVIDEYLLEHQIQGHSKSTIRYYRQNLGWFCEYLNNPDVSEITLSHAREYVLNLRGRNITTVSLQTYTRAVRSFLAWCYGEDYISEDIPKKLKLPKATRKAVDVLTDDEITRLLGCINTKNFSVCAIWLSYFSCLTAV